MHVTGFNYQLGELFENLILHGDNLNGLGNGLANTITGTDGGNQLWGFEGDDTIIGGKGADTMIGGSGAILSSSPRSSTQAPSLAFATGLPPSPPAPT